MVQYFDFTSRSQMISKIDQGQLVLEKTAFKNWLNTETKQKYKGGGGGDFDLLTLWINTIMRLIPSSLLMYNFHTGLSLWKLSSGLLSYSFMAVDCLWPPSSTSVCCTHTGQQMPFSLTGCLHPTGGQDSTKHVTWASWGDDRLE